MARSVTSQRKAINTTIAWAIGLLIFFPILWTILTSFKTEAQAIADPPMFLFFDWTLKTTLWSWNGPTMAVPVELDLYCGRVDHSGDHDRDPCGLVDGICAIQADQRHPALDALDQDAASGWCSVPDLSAVHQNGPAGQPSSA